MANHGYINRSGKNISFRQIAHGLCECYGLTWFFAWFLSLGGAFLLRQWGPISLSDIARHGAVEHDASLAHADTPPGGVYAPLPIDRKRYEEAVKWMYQGGGGGEVIDGEDVARARVNREKSCPPLDPVHAEIARGEMAIAIQIFMHPSANPFNAKEGIPVGWLREWLGEERLPMGGSWRPDHKVGLAVVVRQAREMKLAMRRMREVGGDEAAPGSLLGKGGPEVVVESERARLVEPSSSSNGSTSTSTTSSGFLAKDDLFPAHERAWTPLTEVDETERDDVKDAKK
jgi:hypothetical protein